MNPRLLLVYEVVVVMSVWVPELRGNVAAALVLNVLFLALE